MVDEEKEDLLNDSDGVGIVGNCCLRWRLWIRPVVMCLYFIVIVIVLPLLITYLWRSEAHDSKFNVIVIGGVFTIMAVPISLWDITHHLVHFTKPHMQKYIIRILWMVPIYALNAWLGLIIPSYAIYADTCRECYEAYVIYNFMMFLLTYLRQEIGPEMEGVMNSPTHVTHIFPLCCLKPWPIGSDMIHRCKHGILQYTVVRPLTTVISLICEVAGVFEEGKFKVDVAYPYIIAINNLSQFIAMYHLVVFYRAYREALKPMKPIGKFLCIKAVVFFSFFQGVIIAILVFTGVIDNWFRVDPQHAPQEIQNFLICIEMFLASVAHHYSFSYRPYVDMAQEQQGCCFAFLNMWDVSDVRRDLTEHFNVVGSSVRRRVGTARPTFGYRSERVKEEERRGLLRPVTEFNPLDSPVAANGRRTRVYNSMSDSEHEGITAGLNSITETINSVDTRITVHVDIESAPRPPPPDLSSFIDLSHETNDNVSEEDINRPVVT